MNVLQFSGAIAFVFCLSVTAKAQNACTVPGIAGKYVVKCNGFLTPGPNGPLLPAALLGTAVGERDGTWSGTGGTLSLGGTILTQDVMSVGPAQVNPDCTGTITYAQKINGQPGPNIHFNFFVEKNSGIIDGIGTDPGSVFSCTLTRQSK